MKKYQKHAIAGDTQATLRYAIFLAAFILSEILFYFGYRQFSARFVVGRTKLLRDMTLGAVSQLITTLISYLSYFVVLICATWLVLQGDFSAGNFFVAIGMIDQLSYPLIELVREIRYRNVSFAYPDEKPVLENFSFQAQKGRRYLIKGPSGCGKTTAINLLLRYYDVTDGSIEIDGVPLSKYCSTYNCITVVRQEAVLVHDSLRNNLTMYRDIPDETLVETLQTLGLDKFAKKDALDAMVTENGANLSGGEKKRICLARELLRDTDVLILDEPLANLDDATAGMIEDLLLSIEGKLLLVVSHQFSERKLPSFDDVLNLNKT